MERCPNLLPQRLLRRRSERRRLRQWQWVLLAEACAAGAAVVMLTAGVDNPEAARRQALEATVSQIDVISGSVGLLRGRLQALEQQLAVAREVSRKPDWSILLAALAEEGRGRVTLQSIRLAPDSGGAGQASGYRLTLQGLCDRQSELTGFVEGLERTGLFARVKGDADAVGSGPRVAGGVRTSFTIDATISEGGR
jgi:hypothetical protein